MPSLQEVVSIAEKLSPQERLRLIARLWESLPPESWPAVDETESAEALRPMIENNDRWMDPVPWPIVVRLLAQRSGQRRAKVYSAPRRFDLATIFIVTLAYSVLFAVMSALQLPPLASLAVAGFITFIGLGQAALFGGNRPRAASVWIGAAIYTIAMLIGWLATGARAFGAWTVLYVVTYAVIGGAILGYLAGTAVGGVFLLADVLRRRFAGNHQPADLPEPAVGSRAVFDSSFESVDNRIVDDPLAGGLWQFLFDPRDNAKLYSAPRQFDLASIFIITAVYSLLFGGLSFVDRAFDLEWQPGLTIVVGGVLTSVAVGQAWYYQQANPRGVSVIAGTLSYTLICMVLWFVYPRSFPFLGVVIGGILGGAFLGYIAGAVVGGIFLVADMLRKKLSASAAAELPPLAETTDSGVEPKTVP
jgi:hypothetical protein